jgi:hypothetical protein
VDVVGVALRLVNIADEHEYVEVCAWCRRGFVDDAPAYRHDDTYSVVHLHPACVDAADRQARVIAHLRALRPMIDAFTGADYALTVSRLWSTARDPALPRVRDGHAVAVAQRVAELLPLLEHAYAVDIDDGVT